jgi:hypothetical protein
MKKKTVFVVIICSLSICIGYVYLCFNPIIIGKSYAQNKFLSDSLFNPIDTVDFTKGKNKIIIYTNMRDMYFPEGIKQWVLLECKDNRTIEEVKNNFEFERISEDYVGTTAFDSRIFFFKNNKLVFSGEFIIEKSISLHFENTGWAFATNYDNLVKCFSEFRLVFFPMIKIN